MAAQKALLERYGAVVLAGPLRGMRYVFESLGSRLTPKLVGSYEAEIHSAIEEICATTGALRLPLAQVYGFDITRHLRRSAANSPA